MNSKIANAIEGAILLAVLVVLIVMINLYVITGTDTGSTVWRAVSAPMVGSIGAIGVVMLIIRAVLQ